MKIIKQEGTKHLAISSQEIDSSKLVNLNSVAIKIINLIRKEPMYPKQIAKNLHIHEQNIYYYIKKLEKAGIIKIQEQKRIQGIMANLYTLTSESFFFKFSEFKESSKIVEKESDFLSNFVKNGELDALIVVGSPDPHGPQKARSRDGYFGIDLALFLGTFLINITESKVKLDIELTDKDLEKNLILLGGPIVNKISSQINKKMPIYFQTEKKGVYSSLTKKLYTEDNIGVVNKIKNPFNKEKEIIFVAGIKYSGTKAAVLALLKHFEELEKGNKKNSKIKCRIVEGIDNNFDGVIDDVAFLE